ncbi:MAG: SDR family oxidoreductase [Novosphingobium sp.]|nr:SDR family oxidoreductase [Novosphingobium sp.]
MSRVLVTGGSRGIGRSICLRVAQDAMARGEKPKIAVTATGKSPDLEAVVDELNELGAEAMAVIGDLGNPDEPERIVSRALEFCGGLDALVHNAGGVIAGLLMKTSVEDWDTVFNVNCRALFLLAKAAQPALRESRGSICAIGSSAAESVQPFMNAYPPSKAAVVMLIQQMAYEWGRYGIRANSVSPGLTLSRSTEAALGSEEAQARTGRQIPLGRVGNPEDVAAMVSFVIGPDAGYLTGENINLDGGLRHLGPEAVLSSGDGGWSAEAEGGGMRPA